MKSSNISPSATSTERLSLELSTRKGSQSCGARGRPRRGAGLREAAPVATQPSWHRVAQAGAHGSHRDIFSGKLHAVGTDDVRDAVLDAARAAFHARGYARTSVKGGGSPRQRSHLMW